MSSGVPSCVVCDAAHARSRCQRTAAHEHAPWCDLPRSCHRLPGSHSAVIQRRSHSAVHTAGSVRLPLGRWQQTTTYTPPSLLAFAPPGGASCTRLVRVVATSFTRLRSGHHFVQRTCFGGRCGSEQICD